MSLSIWSSLRFRRAREMGSGYVLMGVPIAMFERVAARLFLLGCQFVACGTSISSRLCWVCFTCSRFVAGHLALRVPCEGESPLLVSESGGVLSGAAEAMVFRSIAAGRSLVRVSRQLEVGRRALG